MVFEVLNGPLMLFGRGPTVEGAEVSPFTGFRIPIARIEPIAAIAQFANHGWFSFKLRHTSRQEGRVSPRAAKPATTRAFLKRLQHSTGVTKAHYGLGAAGGFLPCVSTVVSMVSVVFPSGVVTVVVFFTEFSLPQPMIATPNSARAAISLNAFMSQLQKEKCVRANRLRTGRVEPREITRASRALNRD
jgi:hypothetical protein